MPRRCLGLLLLLAALSPLAAAAPKPLAKLRPGAPPPGATSTAAAAAAAADGTTLVVDSTTAAGGATTAAADATTAAAAATTAGADTTTPAADLTTPDAKAAKVPAPSTTAAATTAAAAATTSEAADGTSAAATTTGPGTTAAKTATTAGEATNADKEAANEAIIGQADLASKLATGKAASEANATATTTEEAASADGTTATAAAAGTAAPSALGAGAGGAGEGGASEGEENATSGKNMTTWEFADKLGASLEASRTPVGEMKAATWEDLGPGDMELCFPSASIEYAPDMPGTEVTTEHGLETCQERCQNTSGCVFFTYWQQPRGPGADVGKCHLQGQDALRKEKLLTEHSVAGMGSYPEYCAKARHLLAGMVTFGAPAISNPPMTNPGGRCIEGLRIFTENTKLQPGDGFGQQEDAASMITRFPHAKTPTYVLHDLAVDEKSSIFQNCPGEPSWPVFKGARYGDWGIHGIGDVYLKRIKEQSMPGVPDYIASLARAVAGILNKFASFTYNGDIVTIREDVRSIPGWTLTGYAEIKGMGTDLDRVLVVQYDTLDCGVVFQGSQGFYDLMSFFIDYGTGYCGFRNTHVGVRNELWSITADPDYQALKPVLAQCRSTHCIGHSLGGALCELFTGCANSGRLNNSDYKQLAWLPDVPKKMEEVKVPGVDFEVPTGFDKESLPYLSSDTRKENPKLSDWVNKLPFGAAFEVPAADRAAPSRRPAAAPKSRGIPALIAGGLPLVLVVAAVASLGRANRARRHGEASEQEVPFASTAADHLAEEEDEEELGARP